MTIVVAGEIASPLAIKATKKRLVEEKLANRGVLSKPSIMKKPRWACLSVSLLASAICDLFDPWYNIQSCDSGKK